MPPDRASRYVKSTVAAIDVMTVVGNELICDKCSSWISLGASCLRNRARIRIHGRTKGWSQQGPKDLCPNCTPRAAGAAHVPLESEHPAAITG